MTIPEFLHLYDLEQAATDDPYDQVYYRASRPKYVAILQHLLQRPPQRLLEIGTCRFSRQLKQLNPGWEVHTLDLTDRHREAALSAGLEFHLGDILKPLPAPSDYFDTIIFSEVIEHLQGNPRLALRHLRQCLKPGGRLILTTPNFCRLANRIKMLAGVTPLETIGPPGEWGGHFREFTMAELLGFCDIESYRVVAAERSMHWDSVELYLTSGVRGFDEATKQFYYRPRFAGWRRPLGYLYGLGVTALASQFPGLRHALIVVAERP